MNKKQKPNIFWRKSKHEIFEKAQKNWLFSGQVVVKTYWFNWKWYRANKSDEIRSNKSKARLCWKKKNRQVNIV